MDLLDYSPPKRRVFVVAAELFATRSYDAVTMTDIAHALSRKKPSLYNHFPSKQDILDAMYCFFAAHIFDERKSLEQLRPILETESVLNMIRAMSFGFPPQIVQIMIHILNVIHQRKFFDEKARKIAKELLIDEGIRYVEDAFNFAIAMGRLAPFNTHWLALLLNDTRNWEYTRVSLDAASGHLEIISNEEMLIYRYAAALIMDLRPTAG